MASNPTDTPTQSTLPESQEPNSTEPNTTNSTAAPSQQPNSHSLPTTTDSAPVDSMSMANEADLDAEIDTQPASDPMNMDGSSDPAPHVQDQQQPNGIIPTHPAVLVEPRIPQKKDASLREFLGKMDDYAPLIPDAVTDYYFTLAGLPPPPETDRRLARLLALATQKFVADVAADAYQYSRIRSTNTTSNNPLTGLGGAAGFGMNMQNMPADGAGGEGGGGKGKKDAAGAKSQPLGGPRAGYGGGGAGGGQGRTVLTMEDLGMAVGEYGVNVKRGEFYR